MTTVGSKVLINGELDRYSIERAFANIPTEYLKLSAQSNTSIAVKTDSKRAKLRNLIADITGESYEEIQLYNERLAIKKAEE